MSIRKKEHGQKFGLHIQPAAGRRPRWRTIGTPLALAASLLFSAATGWSQDVIVDNLSNAYEGHLTVATNVYWANAFTTDDTDHYLQEVRVSLELPVNSTSDLQVALWNDNASLPGNAVVSLSTGSNPTTAGIFTYTPNAPLTLSANTTYWVVLSVMEGAGQYDWNSTLSSTQTGVGTIEGVATYFGGGWIASPASDKGVFAVSGLQVPEPSSLALAAMVCTAGALLRRRW